MASLHAYPNAKLRAYRDRRDNRALVLGTRGAALAMFSWVGGPVRLLAALGAFGSVLAVDRWTTVPSEIMGGHEIPAPWRKPFAVTVTAWPVVAALVVGEGYPFTEEFALAAHTLEQG